MRTLIQCRIDYYTSPVLYIIFIVLSGSALTHVISEDTDLPLRTVLLLVTAELAGAVTGVAPLVHPGAVLGDEAARLVLPLLGGRT